MMMRVGIVAATLGALLIPVSAFAQSVSNTGYALDRFEPSDRGSDWFAVSSLSYSNSNSPAIGAVFDYAHQPLVLRDSGGNEVTDIVGDQMFLHLGASLTVVENLNLGVNLPIALMNSGGSGTLNGVNYSLNQGVALGDLRLGGTYRLFGVARSPIRGALALHVHLPTGSSSAFTGDEGVRVTPSFQVAGDVDAFAYAATLGWKVHSRNNNFAGEAYGSDLEMRLSAGIWALSRKLLIGPELYASSPVSDGTDGFFAKRTTPVELLIGAHVSVTDQWRAGVGAGPGITQGMGSPEVRVVASIEWAPTSKPAQADSDHDSIVDVQDACPEQAGLYSSDRSLNGCPAADRDGDGVSDILEACPEQVGPANSDSKLNGCPAAERAGDRDGDGIADVQDACPDQAGQSNSDSKLNGCPMPDRDGDGITDALDACSDLHGQASSEPLRNGCPPDDDSDGIANPADACPKEPGVKSADPGKNGCPLAKVDAGQIVILEQVQFATGSAEILTTSNTVLEAVQSIMISHPEIAKVSIEGHTDNRGNMGLNRSLSRQRAASVLRWLTQHGIQSDRLTSTGYGPDRPIASNESDAGRQKNRRVEFHIQGAASTGTSAVVPHK